MGASDEKIRPGQIVSHRGSGGGYGSSEEWAGNPPSDRRASAHIDNEARQALHCDDAYEASENTSTRLRPILHPLFSLDRAGDAQGFSPGLPKIGPHLLSDGHHCFRSLRGPLAHDVHCDADMWSRSPRHPKSSPVSFWAWVTSDTAGSLPPPVS